MIFWQSILEKLQDNQKAYLLAVIDNLGSSPGRRGFKMLVAQDGFILGSVGGGIMEFALVEEAHQFLKDETSPSFIKKQIHRGNIEDGSGMICSGEQTVAFHCLNFNHIPAIKNILHCMQNDKYGTLSLKPDSFSFSDKHLSNQFEYEKKSTEDWFFEELIGYRATIYIIGGGHVGVAVSDLFSKLGFCVIVLDDRENLNTLDNNQFAHQKIVVDYNNINDYVTQGNHSYIAIMTNRYSDDKLVLSKLIKNSFKFIGILGSKAKLKTMWKELLKDGFTEVELSSIYAPIGLNVKSQTPEEIAVSIAAQIIQVKNRYKQ